MTTIIRTVTGDIDPEQMGITLTHEHFIYANSGCEYDHRQIYDVDRVSDEVARQLIAGREAQPAPDTQGCPKERLQRRRDHRLLPGNLRVSGALEVPGRRLHRRLLPPRHHGRNGIRQHAHRHQGRHHKGVDWVGD
jgi:hypothetical protein